MAKRYYWLKLPDGFFRQKAIKKLRKIAGGDTYTIIYLKMLLVAMKQDGRLYFEGVEATFYDELALDLDEEVENVRVTVMFLIQQDLMQLIDETEYSLSECAKMTGSESASAERMRRLRDKKASQCDIEVTEPLRIGDVEKEIEIEKEIELELEVERESENGQTSRTYGRYQNVILTDNELTSLKADFPALFAEYIERVSEYMESNGKRYKNHAATIRRWIREDAEKQHKTGYDRDYSVKEDETI